MVKRASVHSDVPLNGDSSVTSDILNENNDSSENENESKTLGRQSGPTAAEKDDSVSEYQTEYHQMLSEDNHEPLDGQRPAAAAANTLFDGSHTDQQNTQQNCSSSRTSATAISNQHTEQHMQFNNKQSLQLQSLLQPPPQRQSSSPTITVSAGSPTAIPTTNSHNRKAQAAAVPILQTNTTNTGAPSGLNSSLSSSRSPVKSLLQARFADAKLGTCPLRASSAEQFFSNGGQKDQGSTEAQGLDAQRATGGGIYPSGSKYDGVPVGYEDMGRVEDGSLLVVSSLSAERKIYLRAAGRWLEDTAMFAQEEIWSTGHLFRQGAVDEIQRRFRDFVELRKPVVTGIQSRNISSPTPASTQPRPPSASSYQSTPPPPSVLPTATMTEHFIPASPTVPPLDNNSMTTGGTTNNTIITSNNLESMSQSSMLPPRTTRHPSSGCPSSSTMLSPTSVHAATPKQPPTVVFPSPLPVPTNILLHHHNSHMGPNSQQFQDSSSKNGPTASTVNLGLLQQLQPVCSGGMGTVRRGSRSSKVLNFIPTSTVNTSPGANLVSEHFNGHACFEQASPSGHVLNSRSCLTSPVGRPLHSTHHISPIASGITPMHDQVAPTSSVPLNKPINNTSPLLRKPPSARGGCAPYYSPTALSRSLGKLSSVGLDSLQNTILHMSTNDPSSSTAAAGEPPGRRGVDDITSPPGQSPLGPQFRLDTAAHASAYDAGARDDSCMSGQQSGNRNSSLSKGGFIGHQHAAAAAVAQYGLMPVETARRLLGLAESSGGSSTNGELSSLPYNNATGCISRVNTTCLPRTLPSNYFDAADKFNTTDSKNIINANRPDSDPPPEKRIIRTGDDKFRILTGHLMKDRKSSDALGLCAGGIPTTGRPEEELNALLNSISSRDKIAPPDGAPAVGDNPTEDFQELAAWIGHLLVSASQEKQGDAAAEGSTNDTNSSTVPEYNTTAEDALPRPREGDSTDCHQVNNSHESGSGIYRSTPGGLAGLSRYMTAGASSTASSQHHKPQLLNCMDSSGSNLLPPLQLGSLRTGQLQQLADAAGERSSGLNPSSPSASGSDSGGTHGDGAQSANAMREAIDAPRTSGAIDIPGDRHAPPSDMKGVNYISASKTWRASFYFSGKLKSKSFSVRKYGHEAAKQLAIVCRQSMEVPQSRAQLSTPPYSPMSTRNSHGANGGHTTSPSSSVNNIQYRPAQKSNSDMIFGTQMRGDADPKREGNTTTTGDGLVSSARGLPAPHHVYAGPSTQNSGNRYSTVSNIGPLANMYTTDATEKLQRNSTANDAGGSYDVYGYTPRSYRAADLVNSGTRLPPSDFINAAQLVDGTRAGGPSYTSGYFPIPTPTAAIKGMCSANRSYSGVMGSDAQSTMSGMIPNRVHSVDELRIKDTLLSGGDTSLPLDAGLRNLASATAALKLIRGDAVGAMVSQNVQVSNNYHATNVGPPSANDHGPDDKEHFDILSGDAADGAMANPTSSSSTNAKLSKVALDESGGSSSERTPTGGGPSDKHMLISQEDGDDDLDDGDVSSCDDDTVNSSAVVAGSAATSQNAAEVKIEDSGGRRPYRRRSRDGDDSSASAKRRRAWQ